MHHEIRRLCVFCGSSSGARPEYLETARDVGRLLAREGITLVYGGGSIGLMGATADAALAEGGRVIGVIPHALNTRELGHTRLTELHVVNTMHERKARMAELADGFLALPGGLGTFEEILEIVTWGQLGIHRKPCGLLNTCGYYDRLTAFLDHAVEEAFVKPVFRGLFMVDSQPAAMLARMRSYRSPAVSRWVTLEQS